MNKLMVPSSTECAGVSDEEEICLFSDSGLLVLGEALKLKHKLVAGMGSAAVEAGLAAAFVRGLFLRLTS